MENDFVAQLKGFSLTTAEILYRMPDHRDILQSYIWQDYDIYPKFPKLMKFLQFWNTTLEGPLHTVTVAHSKFLRPREITILTSGRLIQ
ncbi:MAG TPA: aspartate-semialdehyde dehydrogenase [Candidatus Paceibacterota bacterium]|nr:aspartate-semialdehyde dehydrogenase [Candidatus Paceibacterota bacterium]